MKMINFAHMPKIVNIPNLIEVQKHSFDEFLQKDVSPNKRKLQGLQAAFLDVFPIISMDRNMVLEFIDYTVESPKYSKDEALEKSVTYSLPIKIRVKLLIHKPTRKNPLIKEQEVYLCNLPCMTDTGTFVINGAERVVVNQLHRSPGVIFEEDEEKQISSYGKKLYYARIIPYRGAWVEFEFDPNNFLYVRLDRKRKLLATTLLRAMGFESNEEILRMFYKTRLVKTSNIPQLIGRIVVKEVIDKQTGEIIVASNDVLNEEKIQKISKLGIKEIEVVDMDSNINDVTIHITLKKDNVKTKIAAILEIFKKLRAQGYVTEESAISFFETLLFKTNKRYDLTKVGRYKINKRLRETFKEMKLNIPSEHKRNLTKEDIIATIRYLIDLNNGSKGYVDDIDHLGSRRVRSVGELLENQMRIGLTHMARLVREKMNIIEGETISPRDIINTAPVVGILRKFFGTSQLSQFMDQTNPLAEITHKRRLSALGPGGLNRKRAGFEVRDVHHSHYGRICPIETPEGPNIGLIVSLSIYAKVNKYGLIVSPYCKVVKGKVTNVIEYLTADEEDEHIIAQANTPTDENGKIVKDLVSARVKGDIALVSPSEVEYIDISPKQVVGLSAGLIPFLEHDDANRALMGSNMQRQAVPLMITEPPLVSTGIEEAVARDSGAVILAKRAGVVKSISSDKVIIWNEEENDFDIYILKKYKRSNQDTCIDQRPIVKVGQNVKKGQIIADGAATANGQLSLGKNLLVAFMSWEGYNFEDAILISEKLVKEDIFTSIHIQELEIDARDLTIGSEEITRDIPNVGEEALRNLDEDGIVYVGSYVKPGDILVGKVTPKGESRITPEERLLKVIFGKKAEEVQDASLRVPPGVEGKVLDVQIFSRKGKLTKEVEARLLKKIEMKYAKHMQFLKDNLRWEVSRKNLTKKDKEEINKMYAKEIEELKKKKKKDQANLRSGDELPITVNKLVKVFIVTKRKISSQKKKS